MDNDDDDEKFCVSGQCSADTEKERERESDDSVNRLTVACAS